MAVDRQQDETQKHTRYMEVRIIEINRDAEGVRNVVYSYVANPNKRDVFENRYPKEQLRCFNLRGLEPMSYYLIKAINVGTEKRTKWIWHTAKKVSEEWAMNVYKIRARKPSPNYEMPEAVERAVRHLGVLADDAYGIWKNNNPQGEPTLRDLLVAADSLRTRMSDELRTKWVKALKAEAEKMLEEEHLKQFML